MYLFDAFLGYKIKFYLLLLI